ncbi:MAG: hypothetical protein IPM21_10595 [Acidobacteria bacterium]|nr:hypothetical protein [Acidobacteriota bacterium]
MRLAKDDTLKAAEILESATSLGLEIEHEEERIRMLTDIGNAFIDAKRGDKAIETFERARVFAEARQRSSRCAACRCRTGADAGRQR